ncbi:hypothetical protein [Neobacillus sp. Marseille-QA0830]
METEIWNGLSPEKREKAANLMTEFSTITVSWNDVVQKKVIEIFSNFTQSCMEEHKLKPHELLVVTKMLQEFAIKDLYEWLPDDFENWENKDELMTFFFYGEKGLQSYKETKGNQEKIKTEKVIK